MGKYFGTDGFRGEAGITLTADHAYKVGRFLGWYYNALRERNGNNEPARIVIGKDTRRSSYMFEYSLVAGLTASGNSKNVLYAATTARAKGMKVIGLTGAKDSKLMDMSDVCIKAPQTETYMIQELHLPIYHCLCLMLEDKFFNI